ncbi:MAG TPA: P63C domain-containing protein, partial [Candidatus Elarobacter sp.]|nr:P63C domain-containing protein [Candidatus Elarobacter sp.]
MSLGGSSLGRDRLAKFVGQERLKNFVPQHLSSGTLIPIEFKTPQGIRALGYEATILADICDAVLDARKANRLTKKQDHIAARCEILMRAFARVGIIALVDEVTGYQSDRARDALAKILEAFVAKELQKWVRTFPPDFYQELFRLRGLPYNGSVKRPQYIGHLTNDLIYSRLAPGVLEELRRVTPKDEKGRRKGTFTQRLTLDIGVPRLREHVASVTTLMKASDNWGSFMPMLDRALPPQIALPLFDNNDEKPPLQIGP